MAFVVVYKLSKKIQSLKISYLQGFYIIELTISQSGPSYEFFSFARARDRLPARLFFARVKSPPVLAFSSLVAPPVLPAPHRLLQVPPRRPVSDSYQVLQRTVAMVLLAIGSGRWGVSVAIDEPYMGAKKVWVARRTGRRARSAFCQAVRVLAYVPSLLSHLPSCPKCKLQIQNYWIPLFVIFGKLQECKVQIQIPWRCSYFQKILQNMNSTTFVCI